MSRCKLTLSCPNAVGEQLIERLRESPFLPEGFTTIAGSGHGAEFASASLREHVRGCINVTLIMAVMPSLDVPALLEQLRGQFRGPSIRYWTEPVNEAGDFT